MLQKLWGVCRFLLFGILGMLSRHAKRIVLATVLLMVLGCGASPSVGDRANPAVVVSEPQTHESASPEAPRATVVALQTCVDRHAPRLSADSYAILFDIEANTSGQVIAVKIKDSMINGSDIERCLTGVLERMAVPNAATTMRHAVSLPSRSMVGVV